MLTGIHFLRLAFMRHRCGRVAGRARARRARRASTAWQREPAPAPGPALAGEGGKEAPAVAGSRTPSSSCGCAAVPQGTPRVSFLHEGAQQFANTDRRSAPQHSSKVFAVVAARVLCQQTLLQHSKASNGMHAGRKHQVSCALSVLSLGTRRALPKGPRRVACFSVSLPLSR